MRRSRVVLASALLVVSVSRATCQQPSEIRATAEAEIRAADAAGLKAAQAKDVFGATSNYADDASWLPPNAPLVQGKEAIRSAWEQFLGTPGLKIEWQITRIGVSRAGDMAYALYKYQMMMSAPNGATIVDRGKDMAVWVKKSDGKWKMVADSFNSDAPLKNVTERLNSPLGKKHRACSQSTTVHTRPTQSPISLKYRFSHQRPGGRQLVFGY